MKVLVISDTHGNTGRVFTALTRAEPVDVVIHLGDGCSDVELLREALDVPVINVAGNCDSGSNAPREHVWECEGKRILLTHGDAYQVKSGLARLRRRAEEIGVDAVLFGHTHQGVCENHAGLLLANPGTLSNACQHRSYAVLVITPDAINCRLFDID
ncbi:MAG TPA: metallophosphoesterase [Dongiaceae bacterium]|nr:metallophosphoesterase [Dongiaceae bacterium]